MNDRQTEHARLQREPRAPAARGVARCRVGGTLLVVPAATAYEREMLLEHLDMHAGRHGSVRLRLGSREWTVRHRKDADDQACTGCTAMVLGRFTYQADNHLLCRRCARRLMRYTEM